MTTRGGAAGHVGQQSRHRRGDVGHRNLRHLGDHGDRRLGARFGVQDRNARADLGFHHRGQQRHRAAGGILDRDHDCVSGRDLVAEAAPIPVGATVRASALQGVAGDLVAGHRRRQRLTSTALDFTTLGLAAMWASGCGPDGFATVANNDFCRISAVAAQRLSFDRVPVRLGGRHRRRRRDLRFTGDFLVNGSTKRSNTIERQYLDHSPVTYEYLRGQTLDKFSVMRRRRRSRPIPRAISDPTA
jgi:hypothetical protein